MTTANSFENRLALAFERWADEADTAVDPVSFAAAVTSPRRVSRLSAASQTLFLRRWLTPALLTLLALIALVAAAVGAYLLRQPHRYDGLFETQPSMATGRDSA